MVEMVVVECVQFVVFKQGGVVVVLVCVYGYEFQQYVVFGFVVGKQQGIGFMCVEVGVCSQVQLQGVVFVGQVEYDVGWLVGYQVYVEVVYGCVQWCVGVFKDGYFEVVFDGGIGVGQVKDV